MAAAATSSRSDPSRRRYDVFLNFRGGDTRHSFICYLHDFLRRKKIHVFIDEELHRGNDLSGLLRNIEQSRLSIVVFSENYANSVWCLEELATIMECKRNFNQVVFPVFYKVPISDVNRQTGKFGAPFGRSEENFPGFEGKVPVWKEALTAASDIPGYVLTENSPECEFVDIVAKETFKLLNKGAPSEIRGLPGIEWRIMELEMLMHFEDKSCMRIVGVVGRAGIGKTTIADCVYKRNYRRFDGYCFLAHIHNETVNELLQRLRLKVLDGENLDVGAHQALEDRFQNKKLLVVIDGVTPQIQLTLLIVKLRQELHHGGTRIVLISTDKNLLVGAVDETYIVPRLSGREALQMFCLRRCSPPDPSLRHYDVFLSFQGKDTRHSFTCYLHDFLSHKGIGAFIDEEPRRGDDLSGLLQRIERSKISIVVFSENYANSPWCLEELTKIMECNKNFNQVVFPVFYKVPASDISNQTGKFGAPFERTGEFFHGFEHRIPTWKKALTAASEIAGYVVEEKSLECEFVDRIAKDTVKMLNTLSPSAIRGLPGVERRMTELVKLMEFEKTTSVQIVGVLGMTSIGKTMIARCVYGRNFCHFDGSCFVANIGSEVKRHGLDDMQRKLLRKLLDEEDLDVGAPEGAHQALKDRLRSKTLLIVLDDVTNENQIRLLLGGVGKELYREGTRIVITTRDKKLLENIVNEIYEIPLLSETEALEVFCLSAFSGNLCPTPELKDLSNKFVDYSQGHPLALKLLGSDLYRRDKSIWVMKLKSLQKRPNKLIQEKLKMSYEELSPEEQSIFLDVACFFRSEKLDFVSKILSACHSDASNVIKDLIDKCLITIPDNRLEMHDLLFRMGREIGYESSIKRVGKRSRLWNQEDICSVLKRKMGTGEIRGIFLDMSNVENTELDADIFTYMSNLKFLKFYNSHCSKGCENDCRFRFRDGLDCFPDELVYLHWQGYPLEYLPLNFNPKKLVDLNLSYSSITQLWEDEKNAGELRWVDLSYSKDLLDLSGLLEACKLERLNLRGCINLESLPKNINLKSLKIVILSGCSKLKKFPSISDNIESLYLDGTALKTVPESVESLQKLALLNLMKCCELVRIPETLCKLKSLKELILSGCSKLESFPDINEDMTSLEILLVDDTAITQTPRTMCMSNLKLFSFGGSRIHFPTGLELKPFSGCSRLANLYLTDCNLYKLPDNFSCLSSLQCLCLSRNNMQTIPESIKELHHLKSFYLKHCRNLISLPMLPSNLQYLDAHGCISLESVENPMTLLVKAKRTQSTFVFTDCFKLNRDAQEFIVAHAQRKSQILANVSLQRNQKGLVLEPLVGVSFPGNNSPLWFHHQKSGPFMETLLPPHWCDDKFIGLTLSAVISFKDYENHMSQLSVICECNFRNEYGDCITFSCNLGGWNESSGSPSHEEEPRRLRSDHVFISCNNFFHVSKRHDHNKCCKTTASFTFCVTNGTKSKPKGCEVVKCGMSLVYAPDENDCRLQGLQEKNNIDEMVLFGKETEQNNGAGTSEVTVVSKRSRVCVQEEEEEEKTKRRK